MTIVVNSELGKYELPSNDRLKELGLYFRGISKCERNDPRLVDVVTRLIDIGENSTDNCVLGLIEIPDDVQSWSIEDYAGAECVNYICGGVAHSIGAWEAFDWDHYDDNEEDMN